MQPKSQEGEGYSARDVARLVDMPVAQIRAYIRAGLLRPARGPRGEYRLTFRDVVFLRNARSLMNRLPLRKVNRGLKRLKRQIPHTQDLSAVKISSEGNELVARQNRLTWDPESGQATLDFDPPREKSGVSLPLPPMNEPASPPAEPAETPAAGPLPAGPASPTAGGRPSGTGLLSRAARRGGEADQLFLAACDLETSDPEAAIETYLEALAADPHHLDARINLGRLLHEAGDLAGAELQCRMALDICPEDATAAFNLGVVLEDLKRPREAIEAYDMAIAGDPAHADAHYNLACLHESLGEMQFAIRHLDIYRKLIRGK